MNRTPSVTNRTGCAASAPDDRVSICWCRQNAGLSVSGPIRRSCLRQAAFLDTIFLIAYGKKKKIKKLKKVVDKSGMAW